MSELTKWADALPEMSVILDFLDWLEKDRREIAEPREHGNWLQPITESRADMMNRYFKINARKLEDERSALLHSARSSTEKASK
jgi:hypothetical protein